MDLATFLPRLVYRWWVVVAVAALAMAGAALSLSGRTNQHDATIHFVLRPDTSVPNSELPNALDVLKSDGALVQTVRGVVGSQEMLRQAAVDSHVALTPQYAVETTVRPGSALLDSTLTGPDPATVDRLAEGLGRAAPDYVAANYPAYALDRLGTEINEGSGGLSAPQLLILAALLGAALGIGLVAAEARLQSALRPHPDRREGAHAADARCRALTSKGGRCRNRAIDARGYCRTHLALIEQEPTERPASNGSSGLVSLPEPSVRTIEPADRRRAWLGDKDEG
jgi:hypothetical protein